MRTTGNGRISPSVGALTWMAWVATAEEPSADVTRRRTRWLPALGKVVLTTGPPSSKAPLPARSQPRPMIGLMKSVDVDASDTVSPAFGAGGNQRNDALGCACAPAGATSAVAATAAAAAVRPRLRERRGTARPKGRRLAAPRTD